MSPSDRSNDARERPTTAARFDAYMQPVDVARVRKAHQRLVDVAFRNRDRETNELIRPHFEIPAHPDDDDLIVSRALVAANVATTKRVAA